MFLKVYIEYLRCYLEKLINVFRKKFIRIFLVDFQNLYNKK